MKKAELIADLKSRVIRIYKEHPGNTINSGDREYSFDVTEIEDGNYKEDNYTIVVSKEGTAEEQAFYGGSGKEPPALLSREGMLKQRLRYLESQGDFVMIDPSKLDIKYAKVRMAGAVKYVAELDNELVIVPGE